MSLLLALALLLTGQAPTGSDSSAEDGAAVAGWCRREIEGGVMGTGMRLVAIGPAGSAEQLELALRAAEAELRRVEDLMTTWRESALTRLNDGAGSGAQPTDGELARLVARSLAVAEATDGAFDPTWHALRPFWRFKDAAPALPDPGELERARAFVDWRRVEVDLNASSVTLPAGFGLGLGGIAKGYGVDRAMAVLLEHGVRHGLVDAGGDLKVLGRDEGKLWEVAIKHPRRRADLIALLPVSNTCVVTSGDYERFFEVDGRRYHHILDPRSGYPATGAMSATVLGPDAAFCDAMATALCVLGAEEGIRIVDGIERVECLVVDLAGEVHLSSGLGRDLLGGPR